MVGKLETNATTDFTLYFGILYRDNYKITALIGTWRTIYTTTILHGSDLD
jgi:hypothetical protein